MPSLTQSFFRIIVSFVIVASCKMPEKVAIKKIDSIPTSFIAESDTIYLKTIPRKLFFADEALQQLIDTALKNNPDIQIALQRIGVARAQVNMAKGMRLPSLDAVVTTGVDKFGDYTMNGLGNYDMNLSPNINKDQRIPLNMPDFFVGFRSSWEADIWGKLSNRNKAAYNRLLATEKAQQWISTQLVAHIAALYYELLSLDKEEEIIINNIKLQENGVEIVKAQKAGGRATELAVQQFTAQLLSTQSILLDVKQQIVTIENQLNTLTGKFQQGIKRGKKLTELNFPTALQAGIPTQLLINRPDIREAELLLEAAGAELEASRKAFLPSLNISAYTALNSFNPSFFLSPQSLAYGILGGLVTPVLSKNLLKGNYAVATAAQEEAFQLYRKNIVTAYQEVLTQLKGIEHYNGIYSLKLKETASLQAAVSTSKELYLTGYASYLEVITAQRGVLEAELQAITSKKAIFVFMIDLYRSLGGGWR